MIDINEETVFTRVHGEYSAISLKEVHASGFDMFYRSPLGHYIYQIA